MAKSGFQITNPEALSNALRAMEVGAAESTLRQASAAGATVFLAEMRLRAPVGFGGYERKGTQHPPGFLRDHLLVFYNAEDSVTGARSTYSATWSRDAFYGRFLEYGTSKMAARPFLRPSFEAKQTAAAQAVSDVINKKVQEAMNVK